MSVKNVVVVNDFAYTQGGASRVAINTANLLSEKLNVIFFCGDITGGNELNKNVKVVSTGQKENLKNKNKVVGARNGIYNKKAHELLLDVLNDLGQDTIVHVHGWTKVLSASIFEAIHDSGQPHVVTLHDYFTVCPNGGFYNYKKDEICELCPMSKGCRKCDCDSRNYLIKLYRIKRQRVQERIFKKCGSLKDVIVVSDFSKVILEKYLPDDTNYHKLLNPVVKENKGGDRGRSGNYYVFVGRLSKEKGPEIFCEAVKRAGVQGVVVGDGVLMKGLKEQYKNIKFVGWKKDREVDEYIKKAKALVFPSKWYETAGLTVLEAQSVGVPCIVSKKNAGSEFIKDGKNGVLYDGSVDGLVVSIRKFEQKGESEYAKNVKAVYSKFDVNSEEYVKKILAVYTIIEGRKG